MAGLGHCMRIERSEPWGAVAGEGRQGVSEAGEEVNASLPVRDRLTGS